MQKSNKIICINKQCITEYSNITEAWKITGVDKKLISAACIGKQKTAGGYIWRKKNNPIEYSLEWLDTNKEKFLKKAISIHGDKYDYSDSIIIPKKKINIKCKKHGMFSISYANHIQGQGCKACSTEIAKDIALKKNRANAIKNFSKIHKNKYLYDADSYISMRDFMSIICPVHGRFEQKAKIHAIGSGCLKCRNDIISKKNGHSNEKWLNKFRSVHHDYYKYPDGQSIKSKNKISIICPIHGKFKQLVSNHVKGLGCPKCSHGGGYREYLPGTLYYLKVVYGPNVAYKIGITNSTVSKRYSNDDTKKITSIKEWDFVDGAEARKMETKIKRKFKIYKWTGPDLLMSGNSELFDRDILELDNINSEPDEVIDAEVDEG